MRPPGGCQPPLRGCAADGAAIGRTGSARSRGSCRPGVRPIRSLTSRSVQDRRVGAHSVRPPGGCQLPLQGCAADGAAIGRTGSARSRGSCRPGRAPNPKPDKQKRADRRVGAHSMRPPGGCQLPLQGCAADGAAIGRTGSARSRGSCRPGRAPNPKPDKQKRVDRRVGAHSVRPPGGCQPPLRGCPAIFSPSVRDSDRHLMY